MPRVTTVTACRKSPGTCSKCGDVITTGQPYKHWAFMIGGRGGPKHIRCGKPTCSPTQADLTSSDFLRALYGIQEHIFNGDNAGDLEEQRDDVVSQLEELQSETEDKLNNMPDGLQQGPTGELLQERIDGLSSAIDELNGVECTLEDREGENDAEKCEALAEELSNALADISL